MPSLQAILSLPPRQGEDYSLQQDQQVSALGRILCCCTSVSQFDPKALPDITAVTPSYRDQFPDNEDLSKSITVEEIHEAIGQLQDGKAPGDDGISAELLKLGGAETIRWISTLFNSIWSSESIPSDWFNHLIIPLHKKGRRLECDNYRGIAL